jgi:hypothetical protein
MSPRSIVIAATTCLVVATSSLQAGYSNSPDTPSMGDYDPAMLVAATRSKQRRDNRQDDRGRSDDREERRDCRQDEGVVGKDKRDCKQDARTGKNDKNKDDKG